MVTDDSGKAGVFNVTFARIGSARCRSRLNFVNTAPGSVTFVLQIAHAITWVTALCTWLGYTCDTAFLINARNAP